MGYHQENVRSPRDPRTSKQGIIGITRDYKKAGIDEKPGIEAASSPAASKVSSDPAFALDLEPRDL